jgi:hypothetical protein
LQFVHGLPNATWKSASLADGVAQRPSDENAIADGAFVVSFAWQSGVAFEKGSERKSQTGDES